MKLQNVAHGHSINLSANLIQHLTYIFVNLIFSHSIQQFYKINLTGLDIPLYLPFMVLYWFRILTSSLKFVQNYYIWTSDVEVVIFLLASASSFEIDTASATASASWLYTRWVSKQIKITLTKEFCAQPLSLVWIMYVQKQNLRNIIEFRGI